MNNYSANDYRFYLEHHGVLGQKHGVRNGPPYPLNPSDHSASEKKAGWRKSLSRDVGSSSGEYAKSRKEAKSYQRQLNKIDKKTAINRRNIEEANRASLKDIDKINKNKRLSDEEKASMIQKNKQYYLDKTAKDRKALSDAREQTKKLLEEVESKGYHINQEETTRTANKAKDWVRTQLISAVISSVSPVGVTIVPTKKVRGTKYKVGVDEESASKRSIGERLELDKTLDGPVYTGKRPGGKASVAIGEDAAKSFSKNIRKPSRDIFQPSRNESTISFNRRSEMLKNAKTNGVYNIDFLEAVQNKDLSKSAMIREYEKYLSNPQDYWKKL